MSRPTRPSNTEHPVALGSFRSWMRLLRTSRGIDRTFVPKALFVCLTTLLTSPLRLLESARYGRRIRDTEIRPSPIFIVGHWRSGTTHLQNLLCQDETLGSLSTFQAMAPGFFLTGDGAIKRALARIAGSRYPTRLIDSIPLAMDAPQEDEFALGGLSPHSFIHTFSLPKQARGIFERSVLFEGLSEADRAAWTATYMTLLRKVTLANDGKRLVIKNCGHAARIQTLLELFPDAKFIHIHRNPYEVFLSTRHMHRTVLPRSQLQSLVPAKVEAHVFQIYERLMRRWLADRSLIPKRNLLELRFEDLQNAPLDQLSRLYERLELPGFAAAEPRLRSYLDTVSGYRKNAYDLDGNTIEKVNEHWAFAFDALGYERIEPPQDAG